MGGYRFTLARKYTESYMEGRRNETPENPTANASPIVHSALSHGLRLKWHIYFLGIIGTPWLAELCEPLWLLAILCRAMPNLAICMASSNFQDNSSRMLQAGHIFIEKCQDYLQWCPQIRSPKSVLNQEVHRCPRACNGGAQSTHCRLAAYH
jgi:hypothetical protein